MKVRHPRDFWAGAMFVAIGVAALLLGRRYSLGTAAAMGPGYFPTLLASLLVALGLLALLRSLRRTGRAEAMRAIPVRPLVAVLGSVVIFAVTLPRLGLVLASLLVVGVSRAATPEFRWGEILLFGSILTAFCAAVFVWGLKMPMSLLPPFLGI